MNSVGKARRGCGKREKGGAYLVTHVGNIGTPLQYFLIDPPWVPVVKETGKIWMPGSQGVALLSRPGEDEIYDVWDVIGAKYYPLFPDFYEEGRRHSFSRRIPKGSDFSLITEQSRHVMMHPNGHIENYVQLYDKLTQVEETPLMGCPHHKHDWDFPEELDMCVGLLWEVIGEEDKHERGDIREMPVGLKEGETPTFIYPVHRAPKGFTPVYLPAALLKLPIHEIQVVEDPLEGRHEDVLEELELSGTKIPFNVYKE